MLTLEEEALNNRIAALPVIKDIHEKNQDIINELDDLKVGQDQLNHKVDSGFAKGKERMDGLEDMFKDHINTTKDNHKEAMSAYSDLKTEIRDQKITELKNELKDRKSSDSSLKNDMIKILVVTVISATGYLFVRTFG